MVLPSTVYECGAVKLPLYRTTLDRRTSSNVTGPCCGNPFGVRPTMNGDVPTMSGPAVVFVSPKTPSLKIRNDRELASQVTATWCQLPSAAGVNCDVPKTPVFWNLP